MRRVKKIVAFLLKTAVCVSILLAVTSYVFYKTREQHTYELEYQLITNQQLEEKTIRIQGLKQELLTEQGVMETEEKKKKDLEAEEAVYKKAIADSNLSPEQELQGIIDNCHVENAEYALFTKEILMESFGYDVPTIDYSDTSMERIRENLQEFTLDVCTSGMADDSEREVIKATIASAWNAEDDKLGHAWETFKSESWNMIQDKVKDKAIDFLGDEIKGIVESVNRIQSFVDGAEGLYNAATEDGSSSDVKYLEADIVARIEEELNTILEYADREYYTSSDMAALCYLFHMYGTDIDELNRIAGYEVISFDWNDRYEMLSTISESYQKNEELLKMMGEDNVWNEEDSKLTDNENKKNSDGTKNQSKSKKKDRDKKEKRKKK